MALLHFLRQWLAILSIYFGIGLATGWHSGGFIRGVSLCDLRIA